MGTAFISCALTGLSIPVDERDGRGVLLLTGDDKRLVAEPLWGAFDDLGGIVIAEPSATTRAMWRVVFPWDRDVEPDLKALSRSLGAFAPWRPHLEGISFSTYFVIDEIFRGALAETMPPARREALRAHPIERLFDEAFRDNLLASILFEETLPAERESMREGLIDVIGFAPWEKELGDSRVSPACCSRPHYEEVLELRRARYADHPHMLAALERWKDGWFDGL